MDEKLTKSMAHPLRNKIRIKGIKQVNLAAVIGCSFPSLNRWLNGYDKMPPKIEASIKAILKNS